MPAAEGTGAAEAENPVTEPSNVKATSESKLLVLLSEVISLLRKSTA